jgi:hypothetical protein
MKYEEGLRVDGSPAFAVTAGFLFPGGESLYLQEQVLSRFRFLGNGG